MNTMLLGLAAFVAGHPLQPAGPPPPGRVVDIGRPADSPQLHRRWFADRLFESGAGAFSLIWSLVQPQVSRFTRACSYNRAGYAWSDPGAVPRTFSQVALELRTALQKANEAGPYVLVGQSFGGSLVRGCAARYPGDVAGMVLIDAIHEDGYVVYGG